MTKVTPGRWRSWVALGILTWALLDLTVPGLCTTEEERFPSPAPTSAETVDSSTTIARQATQIGRANPVSSSQGNLDDGCWCCCSHVVPSPHFEMAVLSTLDSQDLALFESSLQGWFSPPYHPPRS